MYYDINALTGQILKTTISAGGTSGIIIAWYGLGTITILNGILIPLFILRSAYQQLAENQNHSKIREEIRKILGNNLGQQEIFKIKEKIQEIKLSIPPLKSDTCPQIIQKAESLGFLKKTEG